MFRQVEGMMRNSLENTKSDTALCRSYVRKRHDKKAFNGGHAQTSLLSSNPLQHSLSSSSVSSPTPSLSDDSFLQPDALQKNWTCSAEKPHECSLCDASFSRASGLKYHIRTHTGEKPYKCTVCQMSFCRRSHLKGHMKTHTGEKPFHCTLCQMSFAQSWNMQVHMRTHTGEKPHKCMICHISFSHLSHLKGHMRTHTGEKPFGCTICQASFSRPGNLEVHRRTHTGEKPYTCTLCQSSFSHSGHLQTHIRTHTGEKPHKCAVCQTSFTQSAHLKRHMRIHTDEKPFECNLCKSSFSHSSELKKHKKAHMVLCEGQDKHHYDHNISGNSNRNKSVGAASGSSNLIGHTASSSTISYVNGDAKEKLKETVVSYDFVGSQDKEIAEIKVEEHELDLDISL